MAGERVGPLWWQQTEELFEQMGQHCEQAAALALSSAVHAGEAKRLAETLAILVKGHLPRPGVRVDLDREVNGVRDCYATHRELRAEVPDA